MAAVSPLESRPIKWILLLLFSGGRVRRYNEPVIGKTRLMKELFLLQQMEGTLSPAYSFRAHKYGPFSNEIYHDLDELNQTGLVEWISGRGGGSFSLTQNGFNVARAIWEKTDGKLRKRIFDVKLRFNLMPLSQLLSYVYGHYGEFSKESIYEDPVE